MVKIPEPDYKRFLIGRKFPEYVLIMRSTAVRKSAVYSGDDDLPSSDSWGLVDSDPHDISDPPEPPKIDLPALFDKVKAYREYLDGLPKDELIELYRDEFEKKCAEDDLGRFFHKKTADADFDYWSKMAHWSLDEAVALSFGKSPKIVNEQSLTQVHFWLSPFVRQYNETMELARRAERWQKLFDPVLPTIFVKWAQDMEIPIPDELVEKVETRYEKLRDWKSLYDQLLEKNNKNVALAHQMIAEKDAEIERLRAEKGATKPLHTKERESLLKLAIGMAVVGYGHDPNAKRSSAVSEIADDLAGRGVALDADTVRKWLKEGAEYLPGEQPGEDK